VFEHEALALLTKNSAARADGEMTVDTVNSTSAPAASVAGEWVDAVLFISVRLLEQTRRLRCEAPTSHGQETGFGAIAEPDGQVPNLCSVLP
jgi:hypothetical protein